MERPRLRSVESIHHAFVIFANRTRRDVDVFWVDYDGKFVHFMSLRPDDRTIVNTFSTHPWIFVDSQTGERMHVDNSEVFWPKPSLDPNVVAQIQRRNIRRTQVDIHFPLRSLRDTVMWSIVKEMIRSENEVRSWEIPKILKIELLDMYGDYVKHKQHVESNNR